MDEKSLYRAIKKRYGKEKAISCWMSLNDITTSDLREKAGIKSTQAVRMYLRGKIKSTTIEQAASALFGFEV